MESRKLVQAMWREILQHFESLFEVQFDFLLHRLHVVAGAKFIETLIFIQDFNLLSSFVLSEQELAPATPVPQKVSTCIQSSLATQPTCKCTCMGYFFVLETESTRGNSIVNDTEKI